MERRRFLRCTAVAAALPLGRALAQEEAWPSQPVTLYVSGAAGSGLDLMARELANRLGSRLKQSVVIDNKPGASGAVATQAAIRRAADGHALLYSNAGNTVVPASLVKSLPYDVSRDLVPIALTAVGGVFLLTGNRFPGKDLPEMIRHVRANPGRFCYGSLGVGTVGHLNMEWLKRKTGMEMAHIPYRAAGQMLAEMMAGSITFGWTDPAAALAFVETGKLRAIAVTGTERPPRSPAVPTMGEQGHPFGSVGWYGVFAPKGTAAPRGAAPER